ncbi:MAG: glycosyltransferase [Alphaproteobacteria bacterium]|nr:MAG: glycosyltransferase [Alphaproteobacteria bacterium]
MMQDVFSYPSDPSLWDKARYSDYLQQRAVPLVRDAQGVWIAIVDEDAINDQVHAWFPSEQVHFIQIAEAQFREVIQCHASALWMHDAIYGLASRYPHYALYGKKAWHERWKIGVWMVMAIASVMLVRHYGEPSLVFSWMVSAISMVFMSMIMFKVMLMLVGHRVRHAVFDKTHQAALLDDDALPIYSVLVPMVDEADSVSEIIASLSMLDYPHEKLEIWLILEVHDRATIEAVRRVPYDTRFRVLIVPDVAPYTKPKACNYALPCLRGEFVTIYDAEDAPNAMQLRHAVALFRHDPSIGCLQACLNWYNWNEHWLTRFFHVEYAMLFQVLLPALSALAIPIPLGGTSNHIRVELLRQVGGWDAFNVTEDADLGIRLASMGVRILPMHGLTLEEAPISLWAWMKQRTRWIKGYIQTWRVLQRRTRDRYRAMGWFGLLGIHYVIGLSSIIYAVAPLMWCLGVIIYWGYDVPLTPRAEAYATTVLVAGCMMQWWSVWSMRHVHGCHVSLGVLIFYPCYFLLHAYAGVRALWHVVTAPYLWEKTAHGKTHIMRPRG